MVQREKAEEKKKESANTDQETNYHDGGTLTHYFGNDEYPDGNNELDEDKQETDKKDKNRKVGYVAWGNSNQAEQRP